MSVDETVKQMALDHATEINALRDKVGDMAHDRLALNQMCYSLAQALGDFEPGQQAGQVIPMDLVRRIVEHRDILEAKLAAVDDLLVEHGLEKERPQDHDLWHDIRMALDA